MQITLFDLYNYNAETNAISGNKKKELPINLTALCVRVNKYAIQPIQLLCFALVPPHRQ